MTRIQGLLLKMTLLLTLHLTAGSAIIAAVQLAKSRDLWILVQCSAVAIRFCTCQIKNIYIYILQSEANVTPNKHLDFIQNIFSWTS